MTYLQSFGFLAMYVVVTLVGVAVLQGLNNSDKWIAEAAFCLGTASILVSWILVAS